jgi:pimeloyl-ACP methyl ester carboxylesterase
MSPKVCSLNALLALFAIFQVGCAGAVSSDEMEVEQLSEACRWSPKPTPIVLVPGSFHGKWAWDKMLQPRVPKSLDVHSLTLPGLGEDAPNANPTISLQTHIAYVDGYLEEHDLRDVTLVVHSYAGMVGAGVLRDDAQGRVSKYVCIDCVVPAGGVPHSFLEEAELNPTLPPPPNSQLPLCTAPWQIKPFVAELYGLRSDKLVDYVDSRLTCQPGGTFVEPLVGFDASAYQRVQATYVYTDYTLHPRPRDRRLHRCRSSLGRPPRRPMAVSRHVPQVRRPERRARVRPSDDWGSRPRLHGQQSPHHSGYDFRNRDGRLTADARRAHARKRNPCPRSAAS